MMVARLLLVVVIACGDNRIPVVPDAAPDASPDAIDAAVGTPDLQLVASAMDNTILVAPSTFAATDCEVVEGCVGAIGARRLLRFDTVTANLGTGDVVIGPPPPAGMDRPPFVWSPCHGHHHVMGYAEYQLLDANGLVIGGHKQAFCLQDVMQARPGSPSHGFNCNNQGISVGWADVYNRMLPCQWIDITGIAPGTYTLRVEINASRIIAESDLTNNEWTRSVTF